MSILQDYEDHVRFLGRETIDAISEYISFLGSKGTIIFYSDVVHKREEWQKFENWRKRVYNIRHGKGSERNRKI